MPTLGTCDWRYQASERHWFPVCNCKSGTWSGPGPARRPEPIDGEEAGGLQSSYETEPKPQEMTAEEMDTRVQEYNKEHGTHLTATTTDGAIVNLPCVKNATGTTGTTG